MSYVIAFCGFGVLWVWDRIETRQRRRQVDRERAIVDAYDRGYKDGVETERIFPGAREG